MRREEAEKGVACEVGGKSGECSILEAKEETFSRRREKSIVSKAAEMSGKRKTELPTLFSNNVRVTGLLDKSAGEMKGQRLAGLVGGREPRTAGSEWGQLC